MSVTPDTDSLARGAHIPDVTTAILLAVAAWCAVVATRGVFVLNVLIFPLPPLLLVYASVCVQVARHLLWPRPSLLWRVKSAQAAIVARPNLTAAFRAFVATRPAVFLVAYFAVVTIGLTAKAGFVLSRDPLANLPARFDAGWYGDIALDGYTWDHTFQRQRNIAFFPAMPMLMRPLGAAFGMSDRTVPRERRMLRALWAGVVISLGAFLWGLYYVTRLGSD